jgi:apolipoprotein D and lipocalin family protein
MARAPSIPDADYARLLALLESYGYEIPRVQKVPQQAAGISPSN